MPPNPQPPPPPPWILSVRLLVWSFIPVAKHLDCALLPLPPPLSLLLLLLLLLLSLSLSLSLSHPFSPSSPTWYFLRLIDMCRLSVLICGSRREFKRKRNKPPPTPPPPPPPLPLPPKQNNNKKRKREGRERRNGSCTHLPVKLLFQHSPSFDSLFLSRFHQLFRFAPTFLIYLKENKKKWRIRNKPNQSPTNSPGIGTFFFFLFVCSFVWRVWKGKKK